MYMYMYTKEKDYNTGIYIALHAHIVYTLFIRVYTCIYIHIYTCIYIYMILLYVQCKH